jgi:Peptidase family M23.
MGDITVSYSPDRWGRAYGYPDPIYTKGYHRAQDLRTLSADGNYSVVDEVISLSAGHVANIGYGSQVGWVVTVDTGRARGRFEHHSHMADTVGVGTGVDAGTRLGRNAGHGEDTGSSWSGPHDHFLITDYIDGAWNTDRPEYDPIPFINEAIGAQEMDYETFAYYLQRALQYDARSNGVGADGKHGPTIWERLNAVAGDVMSAPVQVQDENGVQQVDANGKPIKFPASGFLASTNGLANRIHVDTKDTVSSSSSSLTPVAWLAGISLAVIGLIEFVRFVIDLAPV